MRLKPLACCLALVLSAALAPASASAEAVPGYGGFTPLPQAHEQPVTGRDYKVVFDVSMGPKAADKPNPGLDRLARLANILAAGGVTPDKMHLVAVVHGPATDSVANDEVYGRRHDGAKNPNLPLIAALRAAGASIRICGQSMTASKIAPEELAPGVEVDLAALMTVIHMQQDGYALVVD